jgi:hypothetical protein
MTRGKIPIVLEKLVGDRDLKEMLADLVGENPDGKGEKSAQWSRRFTASGKDSCRRAPRIRLSYDS